MLLKILLLAFLTEALVELFFKSAPLRIVRAWLIRSTPILSTMEQGHLLECKYCTSVWIACGVVAIATFADYQVIRFIAGIVIVSRLSNVLHITVSSMRDFQLNLRLTRK